MTWTVPELGPKPVDYSWIGSLADPMLKSIQDQREAAALMKAAGTDWSQPQVAAPGGLASLGGTPGVAQPQAQPQSGAGMGFSTRAQREGGNSAPFEPLFAQAAQKYGVSPDYLRTTIGIESNFNPNAQNPNSSAGGLGQFIDSTAKQYGLTNKFDPAQAVDATARYAADNKAQLAASLGREPTNGELYMAHQQGVGGAAQILKADPNAPIASVIGANKANINGGAGLTVAQFRQKYESRFGGQQPVQPASTGGVPPFRSGLTPAQDGQNFAAQQQGAPGMQQTGMQPAATGSVADRSIVPGSSPNPVAMDQNQAAGNGDLADLQSIVMNPRSPPNMREWAIGELAKRGIKVPGVQVAQASASDAQPAIQPAPGYTPEQVAAAQQAAQQGQQRYVQAQQARANQPAAGASEVQGGYDVGGGRIIPVDQANNYAQPQQPQPPQNIQPPAQQQPQPSPQQVVGSVPVQAVARFNPQQRAVLAGLLASPGTRQLGMALIQKQLDPGHYGFTTIGSTVYRHNDKTGAFEPLMQVPKDVKWGYTLVNGRLVAHNDVDPSMTRDSTPANLPSGYRPMTQEERANFQVGKDDSAYIGPDGKPAILKGNKTEVTLPPSEKAYDAAQGKDLQEQMSEMQKQARQSDGTTNTLKMLRAQTDKPDFYSGTASDLVLRAKRALVAAGVADAESAAPTELFQKLSNKVLLDMQGGSLGSGFSNADRDFVRDSTANLGNTKEGNKQIIDMALKVEGRKKEIARLAREYAGTHNGRLDYQFQDTLEKFSKQNPLFPEAESQSAPSGGGGGVAPPPAGTASHGQLLLDAQDAIRRGAPPAAVIERLKKMGVDPAGLRNGT